MVSCNGSREEPPFWLNTHGGPLSAHPLNRCTSVYHELVLVHNVHIVLHGISYPTLSGDMLHDVYTSILCNALVSVG